MDFMELAATWRHWPCCWFHGAGCLLREPGHRDDDIRNGLALCCLCHWAFDAFVVSVDRDRTLLVSPDITATPNMPGHISAFAGRPKVPPAESRLAPLDDYLDHHRCRFRDAG